MGVILSAMTAVAMAASATVGAVAAVKGFKKKGIDLPMSPSMAAAVAGPDTTAASEEARRAEMTRRRQRTKTLLTGPPGALGTADTAKKVLLGA